MIIRNVITGQLEANCYIVTDEKDTDALIIDPGDEPEKINAAVDEHGLNPAYIVLTHAHYDHVCAVKELKDAYGPLLVMHLDEQAIYEKTKRLCISWGYEQNDFPSPDRAVSEGDTITVGTTIFLLMHTPGHSPGSICLYSGNTLFTGDTLFSGSVGRTDLHGGDDEKLRSSLKRIMSLPADTRIFCGHGKETTVAHEMSHNPFIRELLDGRQ
jgi:glyoxylase-like metal-dependent hydrolase (beta-lactamase superfamily II)